MSDSRHSDAALPSAVAVVIPAYNAAATIGRALDSVLAQTVPADEILVVDDGSRDNTCEIVAGYVADHPERVRLLTQANAGPSRARNLGVASSNAPLIAFLDADDAFLPERLEEQLTAMARDPACVLCYTGLLVLHADGSTETHAQPSAARMKTLIRLGNPSIPPSCVLLRREAFVAAGGFSEVHKGCEDWELWFRMHRLGSFCSVEKPLTLYQASTTGLSSDADHMYRDFLPMLDGVLLDDLTGIRRFLWRRRILAYQAHTAALTARASGEHGKELRYAIRSVLAWPSPFWFPRRFAALAITLRNTLLSRREVPVAGRSQR